MLGIYDCFGYDVPFNERYKLIKNAGFDCVMLWWSDRFGRGEGYKRDAEYAVEAGLIIENIHAPVHEQDCLSLDNLQGESVFESYIQCVRDCGEREIPTAVIHLPGDDLPINERGMGRIKKLVDEAEKCGVRVAFENLGNTMNLETVLGTVKSKFAGFCYDSCHHANFAPDTDLLGKYGGRLFALHLQDNGGRNNQHRLPFDGNIDWENIIKKIDLTGYSGATSLEPMSWDYEDMSIEEFLHRAHNAAVKLDMMRGNFT